MTYDEIEKEITEFINDPYEMIKMGYGGVDFNDKSMNEFIEYTYYTLRHYDSESTTKQMVRERIKTVLFGIRKNLSVQ